MVDKQGVYELAKRAICVCHNDLFDPTRAGLFAQEYGFSLPPDLLEWLQTCNGGRTDDGRTLRLFTSEPSPDRSRDDSNAAEAIPNETTTTPTHRRACTLRSR